MTPSDRFRTAQLKSRRRDATAGTHGADVSSSIKHHRMRKKDVSNGIYIYICINLEEYTKSTRQIHTVGHKSTPLACIPAVEMSVGAQALQHTEHPTGRHTAPC